MLARLAALLKRRPSLFRVGLADMTIAADTSSPPDGDAGPLLEALRATGTGNMQTTTTGTHAHFRELADILGWLRTHGLTIDDIERDIANACRADGGATPDDIVRHITTHHGIPPDERERILWLASLCHFTGTIQRVRANRYRANTPPPEPHVLALVSIPVREFGLVEPYAYRGRAAFVVEG